MARIFIETTIQVRRFTAAPSVRSFINRVIQNHNVITSSYVWMEFQRTVGQDYQYLIDLFREEQPTTLSELLSLLGEGKNLFSLRRIKRLLQICAKFLDQTKRDRFDPVVTADLLDLQRDWLLQHEFFDGIDQVVDATVCDLVQPEYMIPTGGRMSCQRETARCSLHELLTQNLASLQTLQADPTALHLLETKTQRAFADIMTDLALAKGERNCWSLSDLIITLECPPNAALWTTNLRHFEPLCKAFGRQLFQPTSENKA